MLPRWSRQPHPFVGYAVLSCAVLRWLGLRSVICDGSKRVQKRKEVNFWKQSESDWSGFIQLWTALDSSLREQLAPFRSIWLRLTKYWLISLKCQTNMFWWFVLNFWWPCKKYPNDSTLLSLCGLCYSVLCSDGDIKPWEPGYPCTRFGASYGRHLEDTGDTGTAGGPGPVDLWPQHSRADRIFDEFVWYF